jgi:DNA-3-methyladenine glycosylase II
VKADYGAAVAQLTRRDTALRELVRVVGPCTMGQGRTRRPHFAELARMICYQQLAGAAARTIHGRFEALFDGHPTPDAVLATPDAAMRGAGLSAAKTASIRDLAVRVDAGEVRLARMGRLPDDEVVRELTLVRGIGRWTAEMFLMFQLGRPDVWPVDDLGVRKGYSLIYGLPDMPRARDLDPLGEPFRPYRSVVAWYCWRAVDTVVPG